MVPNPQPDPLKPAAQAGNPVLVVAFILYGTLALLFATIPGSVVSWLQGLDSTVVQQAALGAAEAVESASNRVGTSAPYLRARKAFLEQIGGE
jgi:hypothetical protein